MKPTKTILTIIAILLLQFTNAQEITLTLPLGHTQAVYSANYSPDGKTIVTAGDETAKIWDAKTGKLLQTLEGHTSSVYSANYSPDAKTIVTASWDETAKIWDAKTGKLIQTLKGHTLCVNSANYSPDAKTIVTASWDKTTKIWDAKTGKLLQTLEGHTKYVNSANYSPDAKTIVTASEDKTAKIWDAKTGKLLHRLKHKGFIKSANYSPDGKTIVTASWDKTAKIWDTKTGKLIQTLEGHKSFVNSANYSPDAKTIVTTSVDKTAKIWDAKTGKLIQTLKGHRKYVNSASYSPDGKTIVTASADKTAKIWDVKTGRLLQTLGGHTRTVWSANYSPDAKTIVMISGDGAAKIWDAKIGKLIQTLKGHTWRVTSANYSPDAKAIVTASWDETAKIWDAKTGKLIQTLKGHTWRVTSANYSPDAKAIVTASWDKTAKIWDTKTGKLIQTLEGHKKYVNSANYSPNAKTIVTASWDETAKIWDAKTGKLIQTLKGHTWHVTAANYSPDTKAIVTASWDKTAKIWDAKTGKLIQTLEGHKKYVNSANYSPNAKTIVTASEDKTAKIWNAKTGKLIQTLKGHTNGVKLANYSPDSKTIVTASEDGSIIIWNAQTGKKILQQFFFENGEYIILSPEGYFDGTPEAIKQLYFVKGLEIIPLETYYEQFYRPNLWERIMNGEEIEKASIDFNNQKPLPKIKITNPSTGEIQFRGSTKIDLSTSEKEFNFEYNLTDNGGGIKEVRIFQNGKLVHTESHNINEKDKQIKGIYKLNLMPGNNTIKLTVFNLDQLEKSEECTVEYTGKTQEPAKLYVLAIGLNEYKKPTYNLNYAVPDANAFKQAIKQGSKDIFAEVNITSLQNSQATKINIEKAFTEIQNKAKQSDVFIFYYAGHGSMSVVKEGEKEMFYILPYEVTNMYSQEVLNTNGISANELKEFSKDIQAQKQLFVLDACQSGGAVDMLASRGAIEEKAMALLARSTGTYFLTASGSEQLAGEFGTLGHGVFTYAVLKALSGQADAGKDDKVSVKELSLYVENEVPKLSEKYKGKEQYPVSYGFGQDFPVVISNKYVLDIKEPQAESKYAKFSVEELQQMMKKAADEMDYKKAQEIKEEIEKRK